MITANERLWVPEGYAAARAAGATHAEAMEAYECPVFMSLFVYADALSSGISHAEIMDAVNKDFNLPSYLHARKRLTHEQIIEIETMGVSVAEFDVLCKIYEIAHEKLLECLRAFGPSGIIKYLQLITGATGLSHQDAMEELKK